MKKVFYFILISLFVITYSPVEAKMGFGKSSSFKSYKTFKYQKPKKSLNENIKVTKKQMHKKNQLKSQKSKPSFFQNPVFKWLIGGMIFGALLSFLLGYGLQIGMPGLLEILLIAGIIYFLFKKLRKNSYQERLVTNEGFTVNTFQPKQTNTYESEQINETYLRNMIKNMYLKLYEEWSKGDLSDIKDYLTDKLYSSLEMQLIDLSVKGRKNIIKDIKVKNVDIIHIDRKNDEKTVIAEIEAEMIDYTEDSKGNVISGDPETPKKKKEYWTLVGKGLDWKLDEIRDIEG